MLAPKENSFHVSFTPFELGLKEIIIVANSEKDVLENYLFLKKYIETYDFDDPKKNSKGEFITNNEMLFAFILETFNFVYFVDKKDYFHFSFPNNKEFGKEIFVLLFSVYDGPESLLCSHYNVSETKLHESSLNFCGEVKTNNRMSQWSWDIERPGNYSNIFYTVSLWYKEKLFKIFDTEKPFLLLSDHFIKEEGEFELIVVTKDKTGSASVPALFKFVLKTSFNIEDIKVNMIDEKGDVIDVSTSSSPTFRIYNFNPNLDYILNFDNNYKFSYKESLKNLTNIFYVNKAENALEFKMPKKLTSGSHNLNITLIDEINNTFGDDILSPEGVHGSHFLFFFIADIIPEAPGLVSYFWKDDGSLILSWKSDALSKSFDLFQGNIFLKNTIETVCELEPIVDKKNETIITIIPYGYDGKPSNNVLNVSVKKPIVRVSSFEIQLKDAIVLDELVFTNNPCPTFSWKSLQSTESISNYMCSLDGSNWFGINSTEYTFPKLKDGEYTFRLKAVFLDKTYTQPDANTFNFTLKTNLPSYPIFSQETLNNVESNFNDLVFSWSPINDTLYYELSFNDSSYIKKVYNGVRFVPSEETSLFFKEGWNSVVLYSVSKYGNKSKGTKLNFLVTSKKEAKFKPFSFSPISFEKFYSLKLDLKDSTKNYTYKITDPDGELFEEYTDLAKNNFRNNEPFSKNGIYSFDVFYENKKVIETFFYNFNSYNFKITNLFFNNNVINWEINNFAIYPFFEYSICFNNDNYKTWTRCLSKSTPDLSFLPSGEYKMKVRGFSFDGTLQDEKELFNILIYKKETYKEKSFLIPGLNNVKLNCVFYSNNNSFIIESVSFEGEKVNCFLQFKSFEEDIYKYYDFNKKPILETKKTYDFIINKII